MYTVLFLKLWFSFNSWKLLPLIMKQKYFKGEIYNLLKNCHFFFGGGGYFTMTYPTIWNQVQMVKIASHTLHTIIGIWFWF